MRTKRNASVLPTLIMIAAGLAACIILVTLTFKIVNSNKQTATDAANTITRQLTDIQLADLDRYDGATVYGSEVVGAIDEYRKMGININVYTSAMPRPSQGQGGSSISAGKGVYTIDEGYYANTRDDWYINTSAKFKSTVSYNTNKTAVTSITFEQQ